MKRHANHGVTLFELLIVLAVLGIVFAMTAINLFPALERAKVREASSQIVADIERLRSSTRRLNRDSVINILGNNVYNYQTGNDQPVTRTLDASFQLAPIVGGTSPISIVYRAPFGESSTSVGPIVLRLSSSRTAYNRRIKVIGVTGKVFDDENP